MLRTLFIIRYSWLVMSLSILPILFQVSIFHNILTKAQSSIKKKRKEDSLPRLLHLPIPIESLQKVSSSTKYLSIEQVVLDYASLTFPGCTICTYLHSNATRRGARPVPSSQPRLVLGLRLWTFLVVKGWLRAFERSKREKEDILLRRN